MLYIWQKSHGFCKNNLMFFNCCISKRNCVKIVGSSYHYYSHRNISNFISRSGILLNRYVCWIIRGPNTVCNHGRPCFDVHRFVRCYENFRQVCLTNNLNITLKLLLLNIFLVIYFLRP